MHFIKKVFLKFFSQIVLLNKKWLLKSILFICKLQKTNTFFVTNNTMFKRLKNKWNVSWWQFTLIFCTFALGGSLCGYAGRKLLGLCLTDRNFIYYTFYILLITLLWPLAVLIVSIPLGQFAFFKKYIQKIFRRFF